MSLARGPDRVAGEWASVPMAGGLCDVHDCSMTTHAPTAETMNAHRDGLDANGRPPYPPGAAVMTAAGLDELRSELERLRQRTRKHVEQRLREARPYGEGSNNDEYQDVREEQMVLEARLAALEGTIDRAVVVDSEHARRGAAVIGATVTIEDLESGLTSRHRLCGAHQTLTPDAISAASPMGQALMGARAGAIATIDLPKRRSRRVRLVAVKVPPKATGGA
jgi:transcription elongation factor GreA